MSKRLELAGQKFGRLAAIKFSHVDKWGDACWLCKCDCGNETTVTGSNLKRGRIKSCGCLQKELCKKLIDRRRLPKGVAACKAVIRNHRRGAKERNLEQALTDEQMLAIHKKNCHYCGIPPSNTYLMPRGHGSYTYNGIDRINNDIGYTLDNAVPCCWDCNKFKKIRSYEGFIDKIKQIHSHLNLQNG